MKNCNKEIEKMLKKLGAKKIEFYVLVNNDGFTFEYEGKRYDLRHWRNVYGVECDFWDCTNVDDYKRYNGENRSFMQYVKNRANEIEGGSR